MKNNAITALYGIGISATINRIVPSNKVRKR